MDPEEITFTYEGEVVENDYDGPVSRGVYSCSFCGALVTSSGEVSHQMWHVAVGVLQS